MANNSPFDIIKDVIYPTRRLTQDDDPKLSLSINNKSSNVLSHQSSSNNHSNNNNNNSRKRYRYA